MRYSILAALGAALYLFAPTTANAQNGAEHFRAWDRFERAQSVAVARRTPARGMRRAVAKRVVPQRSPVEQVVRAPIQAAQTAVSAITGALGIVPNPPCPEWVMRGRVFCGCGVSIRVFGVAKRELFVAGAWLRFPPAAPAPGMIAANRQHVFYIERVLPDGRVVAYDPNSGGGLTRVHVRSLAGFSVRNPRG